MLPPQRRRDQGVVARGVLVGIGALEHAHAVVVASGPERLGLLPGPVFAGVREAPERPEILLGRKLALGDADVARDPALADDRVVAAGDIAGPGLVVEHDLVAFRDVVEAEIHAVVDRLGPVGQLRNASAHDREPGREPAVVHRGQAGLVGLAARRPDGDLLAGAVVVPVEELAALRVALHPLERGDGLLEAAHRLIVIDDPELLRADGAPHVGADVRGRRLDGALTVRGEDVGWQARLGIGHRHHRLPGIDGVPVQRVARCPRRVRRAAGEDAEHEASKRDRGRPGSAPRIGPTCDRRARHHHLPFPDFQLF